VSRGDAAALAASALAVALAWLAIGTQAELPPLKSRGWSGDFIDYYLPNAEYAGARWARGEVPLWNPHHSAGGPFLATLQVGALYPPNLLHAWLPADTAFLWLAFLHVALSAVLAGGLASSLGAGRLGAAVAGLAYASSLQVVGTIWSPATHYAASLAPGVLWGVDRVLAHPSLRRGAMLAAAVALSLLSGWPYTFAMVVLASGLYTAAWAVTEAVRSRRVPWRGPLVLAGAGGIGALLAAPQMLPALEILERSCRALGSLIEAQAVFVGKPHSPASFFTDLWKQGFTDGNPGPLSLLLAVLAVVLPGPGRGRVALLLAIGGLALLISWPAHAPLYGWLRELPLLGDFRFPYKYRLLTTLALSVAAGVGVTHLQRALARWPRLSWTSGVGALAVCALTGSLPVWSQVLPFARNLPDPVSLAAELKALGLSEPLPEAGRIYWTGRGDRQRDWEGAYAVHDLEPLTLARSAELLTFFETGRARTVFTQERKPVRRGRRRDAVVAPFSGRLVMPKSGDRAQILDLFAADTIVSDAAYAWLGRRYRLLSAPAAKPGVYANPHALPRVYRVSAGVPEPARIEAALTMLTSPDFDPTTTALLDRVPADLRARGPVAGPAPTGETRIDVYEPERVVISTRGGAPGIVVLSDAHYPGWQALLDGEPVELLRANLNFRGVAVPAGSHQIEMRYRPASFRWGLVLALMGAVAGVGALAFRDA
jgi:hypothetical protein